MEPISIGDFEYHKKDLIGHGAFAVVFKGRYKKSNEKPVAIKCITKKNLAKSQSLLSKEIKILQELSDLRHENVVQLLDCKDTSHHVYLVMEYCNGGDLADYLQVKGTLSEDTISGFLKQIAAAMRALNGKGIVHRDLKPQNILLCHAGRDSKTNIQGEIRLKIADFGFARFLHDGVMAATLCGSPMYMAPEVIMSLQYDAKADLWSVGTIVYQCLTGKAPFQAQTPQQLKQFYERNANLQPNIPSGTSSELRNLLMCLLKRNAKDRIEFDDFFNHPFVNPRSAKPSSPVPVPRARSRSSSVESPPLKAVSASPLSGNMPVSPPNRAVQRVREQSAPDLLEQGSSPQEVGGFLKVNPVEAHPVPRAISPAEDFVMVPENIPSDHSVSSAGSRHHPSSVDLNAIFSDNSPDSPKMARQSGRRVSSRGNSQGNSPCSTPTGSPAASPSRPSTLSVGVASQPMPVPGQVKAFQQMQASSSSPRSSSPNPGILRHVATTPGSLENTITASGSEHILGGIPIPGKKSPSSNSFLDVGSMSPPSVQFTVGTPPSAGKWRRSSVGCPPSNTPPSNASSPLRRSGFQSPRISTPPTSLAPIVGSPTKAPTEGFRFPTNVVSPDSPAGQPIQTPFASARTQTCPDNMAAAGLVASDESRRHSVVPVRCATEPLQLFHHSPPSKLSQQMLRAAFGTSPSGSAGLPSFAQSPPGGGVIMPFLNAAAQRSPDSSPPTPSSGSRERKTSVQEMGSSPQPMPKRRHSSIDMDSPSGHVTYCSSPPDMEGPISFVAPELAEETLMDREHNETVSKLNFVLALVECIMELASSRSSPLTESLADQRQGNSALRFDTLSFASEPQRHMEQLVLYVRGLQLLSSAIMLAKEETKSHRLKPSNSVKLVLRELNNYYQQCLTLCRRLHARGVGTNPDVRPQAAAVTADKLIYSYAIEMCQTAALDELFGHPQECFRRYRSAQILLHSLCQQAHSTRDKNLLNKYKESVEKRLYTLSNQGFITAYDSS